MSRTASPRAHSTNPEVPRRNGQPRVLSRGDLRLLVLALIGEQPRHGYELMQLISNQFMQAYTPSAGTMYPLLASFEQAGWIEAEEVDGKRIFRITAAGEFELKVQRTQVRLAQRRAFAPCPRDHQGLAAAAAGRCPARVQAGTGASPRPLGRGRSGRSSGAADAGIRAAQRYGR